MIGSNKSRRSEEALRIDIPDSTGQPCLCDFEDCNLEGIYKAPKGPRQLRDYYFFCIEHVRQYNKAWNYSADFNEEELEHMIRQSTTWERPSWPFGSGSRYFSAFVNDEIRDIFGVFEGDKVGYKKAKKHEFSESNSHGISALELDALDVMELKPPVEIEQLKSRYKHLVKLNHPDRNGGDKDAEERLKLINEAYTTLKQFLKTH